MYVCGCVCVRVCCIMCVGKIAMCIFPLIYIKDTTCCQGIFKYCLMDMLGRNQQETLYFFDCLTAILAESHVHDNLNNLRNDLNKALAMLERDFPLSIHLNYQDI